MRGASERAIRVAAAADLHMRVTERGRVADSFRSVSQVADLLLLPGDLTDSGTLDEAEALAEDLEDVGVPVFAVLGNHDMAARDHLRLAAYLSERGIRVLDGQAAEVTIHGWSVGIAGAKGFAGGFGEYALADRTEPEMQAWIEAAERETARIDRALAGLHSDFRMVMLHYSPVRDTVVGEPVEKVAFYGSSMLAEPVDRLGADLVVHGHSHCGTHTGSTPGGIRVFNVSWKVIGRKYCVLELGL